MYPFYSWLPKQPKALSSQQQQPHSCHLLSENIKDREGERSCCVMWPLTTSHMEGLSFWRSVEPCPDRVMTQQGIRVPCTHAHVKGHIDSLIAQLGVCMRPIFTPTCSPDNWCCAARESLADCTFRSLADRTVAVKLATEPQNTSSPC